MPCRLIPVICYTRTSVFVFLKVWSGAVKKFRLVSELGKEEWCAHFTDNVAVPLLWCEDMFEVLQRIFVGLDLELDAATLAEASRVLLKPVPDALQPTVSGDVLKKAMSTTKIKETISAGSRETKDTLLPFVEALKDNISALWNNAAIPRLANDEGDDEFEPHACAIMEVDVESPNYDNAMRAARDLQDSVLHVQLSWLRAGVRLGQAAVPLVKLVKSSDGHPPLESSVVPLIQKLRRTLSLTQQRIESMGPDVDEMNPGYDPSTSSGLRLFGSWTKAHATFRGRWRPVQLLPSRGVGQLCSEVVKADL